MRYGPAAVIFASSQLHVLLSLPIYISTGCLRNWRLLKIRGSCSAEQVAGRGDLTVSSHGAGANSLEAARIPAWPPTVLDRLAAASGWDGLAAVAGRLGCDAAWEKGAASGRARARW
jgi:hypothetical protein